MPPVAARSSPTRSLALAAAGAVALLIAPRPSLGQELDVPYVATPMEVVSTMLELAEPTPRDSLYDLGSGDGRIVITAAERYRTPGVGVELDPERVATAREKAAEVGVGDLVRFVQGDLFEVDLSGATVVTLYLLPSVNREIRPKLLGQLRPGSRVVSHDFDMGAWRADSVVHVAEGDGGRSTVYFWNVPAHVAGTWIVARPGGAEVRVVIDQKFQEVRGRVVRGDASLAEVRLSGDSLSFLLDGERYAGEVAGDGVRGTAGRGARWSGRRVSGGEQLLDAWHREAGFREVPREVP